jgi:hypothetical protein
LFSDIFEHLTDYSSKPFYIYLKQRVNVNRAFFFLVKFVFDDFIHNLKNDLVPSRHRLTDEPIAQCTLRHAHLLRALKGAAAIFRNGEIHS